MAQAFQTGPRQPATYFLAMQSNNKDNNQIMFGNQNNYQNQNLSIIMYHKDKPIPEFDYFLEENLKTFACFGGLK
jgi:hypothetical protein